MAKLDDKTKQKIIADWKAGHSQNRLAKDYELSPATINKLCKGVEQENVNLVNTQIAINKALADKSEYEVNSIQKAVDEKTRHLILVNKASELAIKRSAAMLASNKKQAVVKVKTYNHKGVPDGEKLELKDVELEPQDIKSLADAIDKSSVTLGVNQRFANAQINIQNTNAQQNTTIKEVTSSEEASRVYMDIIGNR